MSTMVHSDYLALLEKAADIARDGGRLMLELEETEFTIELKSAKNFVTTIDLAVEQLIVRRLSSLTPSYRIVTEETHTRPVDLAEATWILDPVDGTTNLMRGFRISAISLALAVGGQLVAGLVYNPYADEMFTAVAGQGSALNGRPIQVSRRARLDDCMIGFGTSPYDRSRAHQTFAAIESIFLQSFEIRRCGSAALDLAYVACGRLDGFFEWSLQPWDYAAGSLILAEAGGQVTNWQGASPSLLHGDSILASNGLIHDQVRSIVAGEA